MILTVTMIMTVLAMHYSSDVFCLINLKMIEEIKDRAKSNADLVVNIFLADGKLEIKLQKKTFYRLKSIETKVFLISLSWLEKRF